MKKMIAFSLLLALTFSGSLFASVPRDYRPLSPGGSYNKFNEEISAVHSGYVRPLNKLEQKLVRGDFAPTIPVTAPDASAASCNALPKAEFFSELTSLDKKECVRELIASITPETASELVTASDASAASCNALPKAVLLEPSKTLTSSVSKLAKNLLKQECLRELIASTASEPVTVSDASAAILNAAVSLEDNAPNKADEDQEESYRKAAKAMLKLREAQYNIKPGGGMTWGQMRGGE